MSDNRYVLDSYAIVAWLQGEQGGETVSRLLTQAGNDEAELFVSLVNLGEVLYILEREDSLHAAQEALALLDSLPLRQEQADRALSLQAAHCKARYRMSYADCFAFSLAKKYGAVLVTGDPEFRQQSEVKLLWVGPSDDAN
ncbi:MAG: type II toxin-antitoxin system VapC family toxin [Bacillota bacterium]